MCCKWSTKVCKVVVLLTTEEPKSVKWEAEMVWDKRSITFLVVFLLSCFYSLLNRFPMMEWNLAWLFLIYFVKNPIKKSRWQIKWDVLLVRMSSIIIISWGVTSIKTQAMVMKCSVRMEQKILILGIPLLVFLHLRCIPQFFCMMSQFSLMWE